MGGRLGGDRAEKVRRKFPVKCALKVGKSRNVGGRGVRGRPFYHCGRTCSGAGRSSIPKNEGHLEVGKDEGKREGR